MGNQTNQFICLVLRPLRNNLSFSQSIASAGDDEGECVPAVVWPQGKCKRYFWQITKRQIAYGCEDFSRKIFCPFLTSSILATPMHICIYAYQGNLESFFARTINFILKLWDPFCSWPPSFRTVIVLHLLKLIFFTFLFSLQILGELRGPPRKIILVLDENWQRNQVDHFVIFFFKNFCPSTRVQDLDEDLDSFFAIVEEIKPKPCELANLQWSFGGASEAKTIWTNHTEQKIFTKSTNPRISFCLTYSCLLPLLRKVLYLGFTWLSDKAG